MVTPATRPEVGDTLQVIHDFTARSSDELTLAKGDRVELIERDDEFGDGWFLGKHLVNGNSGLFPEVYTRPASKVTPVPNALITSKPAQQSLAPPVELSPPAEAKPLQSTITSSEPAEAASPPPSTQKAAPDLVTLPLNPPSASVFASTIPSQTPPISSAIKPFSRLSQSQDNHVLHETLNVIDEHIDNLRSGPSNGGRLRHVNDSESEYSSHIDHRLSYIAGEETDDEEDRTHSRLEVESWTSDEVAEYLFTSGVEKHHCEVFRDQEITGDVLLSMDQTSLFIKAFDLGSVGRRLKTWQKIKALQDEVNGIFTTRPNTQVYGSEAGSDGARRTRSRNNTITGSINRLSAIDDRALSQQKRMSIASLTPKRESAVVAGPPVSPGQFGDSTRPMHEKRPSAASIRDLHHSRRHSSTDFRLTGTTLNNSASTPKLIYGEPLPQMDTAHKKQPSFDRNWTLGSAAAAPRPLSGSGFLSLDSDLQDSAVDLDRGYFSSAEGGGKNRNLLKKRDSTPSYSLSTSYAEEQRVRSATAMARHSRYGSIGSMRGEQMPTAAQKYYCVPSSTTIHRRTLSTTSETQRAVLPIKDMPPTVTKLDTGSVDNIQTSPSSPVSSAHRQAIARDVAQQKLAKTTGGLRAASDAVTGQERAKVTSVVDSSLRDSPLQSPSRTGSSTPSAGPSFEFEFSDATKSPSTLATLGSRNSKKKGKKETSAYTRGLMKISPRQAMLEADYSGWMKKKSNGLMTTWKARLFILKGRRLAYYYSEDDEQEKGLIDISFHRVLPANNERLTGLHATLTGASNTPTMPANSNVPTIAGTQAEAESTSSSDAIFIFKLVPPRTGLSRAVHFTKPTVHYFAVPNIKQGRLWMAALMKATIDRDDTQPIVTSYQQKTISLAKAREMRHRPPALMNLDEKLEAAGEESQEAKNSRNGGLGIFNGNGRNSSIARPEKLVVPRMDSVGSKRGFPFIGNAEPPPANLPQSA